MSNKISEAFQELRGWYYEQVERPSDEETYEHCQSVTKWREVTDPKEIEFAQRLEDEEIPF